MRSRAAARRRARWAPRSLPRPPRDRDRWYSRARAAKARDRPGSPRAPAHACALVAALRPARAKARSRGAPRIAWLSDPQEPVLHRGAHHRGRGVDAELAHELGAMGLDGAN